MFDLIRDEIQQENILLRIYKTDNGTTPYLFQALDNDCGERIESLRCRTLEQAEHQYNKYTRLYSSPSPVLQGVQQ